MSRSSRILALAGKELKVFFADFQQLFFSLALPVVMVLVMTAAFGGETSFHATAYVVNLDRGSLGSELVSRLDEQPEIDVELLEEATADERLGRSQVLSVIVIGPDFTEQLEAGRSPNLTIRRRGTGGDEGQIAASCAIAVAHQLVSERLTVARARAVLSGMGVDIPEGAVRQKVSALYAEERASPTVTAREQAVAARSSPAAVFLPGMLTMFTLFTISLTSITIVEERKKGTLERLVTTRASRGDLLLGFWLGGAGRGILQVVLLLGLGWLMFRTLFTPGSFALAIAFGVLAVIAVSAAGLAVASVARTPDQANWMGILLAMVMSTLGGSFWSLEASSGIVATLGRLTYNFYANDALRRIIVRGEGLGSPAVLQDLGALAVFAVITWAVALALFRVRRDDK